MIIIGITGTIGAGKGTVVEYLKDKYGFKHYSASDYLKQEIARRGIEENRDNMRIVGNDLRASHQPSYVIEQLYNQALNDSKDNGNLKAIIESIRSLGEIKFLKSQQNSFVLLGVDADPKIRYERIVKRKSSKDQVTFEEFLEDEQVEKDTVNPSGMNLPGCMALADYIVNNNGNLEDLHKAVDAIVAELGYPL